MGIGHYARAAMPLFFSNLKKKLLRPGRLGGRLIHPPPNWALESLLSKEKPRPASTRRLGGLGGRVLEPWD